MALEPPLVAADPALDLVEGGAEGGVGVHSQGVALQGLARREKDRAVHAEGMALAADDNISGAPTGKDPADGLVDLVDHPLPQGGSDVDMFSGDLNFHEVS
jgi:hypothetical protein